MKITNVVVSSLFFLLLIASIPVDLSFAQKNETNSDVGSLNVVDPRYSIGMLVPDAHLYGGINGLAFDNEDKLYVGAVAGVTIFNIDAETGAANVFMGPPNGGADDMVFDDEGTMYWNAFFLGKVFKMTRDGKVTLLGENIPGCNAIDLNDKKELFVTQCFFGDALWKIDTTGGMNNVKIAEDLGFLNGFEIGKDGYIYGPLWKKGQVVKVDTTTGKVVKVIAAGFKVPCACNFDSKGTLWALDSGTGEIFTINIETGEKKVVATQAPHLDNLAIDSRDRVFITNMNSNGVYEVLPEKGSVRTLTEDKFVFPQGLVAVSKESGEYLYIADNFAYKTMDVASGTVGAPENHSKFVFTASISQDGKHILMGGWAEDRIQVFNAETHEHEYDITGLKKPTGMYMRDDGSIIYLESVDGNVAKIDDKEKNGYKILVSGLDSPTLMAVADTAGREIFVTEYGAGRVSLVNTETGDIKVVSSALKGPEGIARNKDGHLIVLDTILKTLVDIDPQSGGVQTIIKNLPVGLKGASVGGPAASPFNDVSIAQESGNIYITSELKNTIFKVMKK